MGKKNKRKTGSSNNVNNRIIDMESSRAANDDIGTRREHHANGHQETVNEQQHNDRERQQQHTEINEAHGNEENATIDSDARLSDQAVDDIKHQENGKLDSESATEPMTPTSPTTPASPLSPKLIRASSSEDSERIKQLQQELQEAVAAKETAEEQYENLLERISHIKATLGSRLKSDDEKILALQQRVEELQDDKATLKGSLDTVQKELVNVNNENNSLSQELSKTQKEYQASMSEWSKERDNLLAERKRAIDRTEKSELLQRDLEVALADEKIGKSNFNARLASLQEQIDVQTRYAERYRNERDDMRNALQDAQKAYETKSLDFTHKATQLEDSNQKLASELEAKNKKLEDVIQELETTKKSVEALKHFEEEIKEKNLLIGKLRHEAVILNEHLTKALRMIKKDSEGEMVDKQLISNLILSFLSFPRGDTKKFEVLQLISSFLAWDEDQKVQAGLSRTAVGSTFVPPKRSGSSSSLASQGTDSSRFMGLFAEFLEREGK